MKREFLSQASRRSVQAVREIEGRAIGERTAGERVSDWVARRAGTVDSIGLHMVWYAAWLGWNSDWFPRLPKFDPYPFAALTTIVSLEAIFLSLFVLASQSRASRRADERAHLDLQVNLLAEKETTKLLQMVHAICRHLELPEAMDSEAVDLSRPTDPHVLAQHLQTQLPSEDPERSPIGSSRKDR